MSMVIYVELPCDQDSLRLIYDVKKMIAILTNKRESSVQTIFGDSSEYTSGTIVRVDTAHA